MRPLYVRSVALVTICATADFRRAGYVSVEGTSSSSSLHSAAGAIDTFDIAAAAVTATKASVESRYDYNGDGSNDSDESFEVDSDEKGGNDDYRESTGGYSAHDGGSSGLRNLERMLVEHRRKSLIIEGKNGHVRRLSRRVRVTPGEDRVGGIEGERDVRRRRNTLDEVLLAAAPYGGDAPSLPSSSSSFDGRRALAPGSSAPSANADAFVSATDGSRRSSTSRRTQNLVFAVGVIVHSLSPGIRPKKLEELDIFYCAAAGRVSAFNKARFNYTPGEALDLRDCFETPLNFTLWRYTDQLELKFATIANNANNYYIAVDKPRKGQLLHIEKQDIYDPNQVWSLRPGPDLDHTWRPDWPWPNQRPLCASATTDANGTVVPGSNIRFTRCLNERSTKLRRRLQEWVYCFEALVCNPSAIGAPDFSLGVRCNPTAVENSIACFDTVGPVSTESDAVPFAIWDRLAQCRNDPVVDNRFDSSLLYKIDILNDNDRDDWLDVRLQAICGSNNDGDTYLRVYEAPTSSTTGQYNCAFVGRARCDVVNQTIVRAIANTNERDYLFVVSADNSDRNKPGVNLTVGCAANEPVGNVTRGNLTVNVGLTSGALYCYEEVRANVVEEEKSLPNDFNNDKSECRFEPDDLDIFPAERLDDLKNTWYNVETYDINATVNVTTLCNRDGASFDLETLFRLYRVDENNSSAKYNCRDSFISSCANGGNRTREFDLPRGHLYMIVATGVGQYENCAFTDFDCR